MKNKLLYLIEKFKNRYQLFQKKLAIARIRDNMSCLGFNISNMTDEEIEQGTIRIAQVAILSGISTADAAEAFNQLASALKEVES